MAAAATDPCTPAPLVRLFVYGTLMDENLVWRLTGRTFCRRAAVLAGYQRIGSTGGYPAIVPDATARVEGILLEGVDPAALRLFDEYESEGTLYRRIAVVVEADGAACDALVYVGLPQTDEVR